MFALPCGVSAKDLAKFLKADLVGDDAIIRKVESCSELNDKSFDSLVFVSKQPHLKHEVACALATEKVALAKATIIVQDPKHAINTFLEQYKNNWDAATFGIHSSVCLADNVVIGKNVNIGPYAVIEEDVIIGDNVTIDAYVHIMKNVTIGSNSKLANGVVCYPYSIIGKNVSIGSKSVIGDAGFGYYWKNEWLHFIQVGKVIIEDNVHIGPYTLIDRGAIADTVIGYGSVLDAHNIIGHGVKIGKYVLIAAGVAIGGSTVIEDGVIMGGRVSIADHVKIKSKVRISGGSLVGGSINKPGDYCNANPIMSHRQWYKWIRSVLKIIN